MYRVLAMIAGGLLLSACSSTPDWMSLDALKPAPPTESVAFESEPPGAEVKTSNGQACRTPCSLTLPSGNPMTATFTLAGFQPASEQLELVPVGDGTSRLRPNPVLVELTPAPPAKPAPKKPARKPAAKPRAAAAPAAAATPAPQASGPATPWPAPQQR
ncbi:MAG: hypothetical protein JOZ70_12530 [Pseudolabrys sp.]|nr:hypothetical protein [Pseudolabrys sp.]MBV9956063.1 hypothetical protein [Pseudolabrys sp.]